MPVRAVEIILALLAIFQPLLARVGAPLVDKAREQIGVTTSYDPSYRKLPYPGGDVPRETGVCSDVVVRAFRGLNVDLQREVHEDMAAAFERYPRRWGLTRPDSNIDQRRVPNLMTYFKRKGWTVARSKIAADYQAADVVAWDLGGGVTHIGIISDHKSAKGTPLVIHNIGNGVQEEDILFRYEIIGHYRPKFASGKRLQSRSGNPGPAFTWTGSVAIQSNRSGRGPLSCSEPFQGVQDGQRVTELSAPLWPLPNA